MGISMIINIIFLATCYPIMFVLYFLYRDMGDKNTYCFGATLKRELREDPAVQQIIRDYKRNLKRYTIIVGVIPVIFLLIESFSINMSLWMIWLLVMCFVPMFWMAKANIQIKELKKERGWQEEAMVSYTDLKTAAVPRRVKFTTFLPTLILSIIPVILAFVLFQQEGHILFGWMIAIFGICTIVFYLCALWTDRQRVEVICEDSDTNMNFARAKKQAWKNYWLLCAWLNTAFTWFMLYIMWQRNWALTGLIWGTIVYCVVIMVFTWKLIKSLFSINNKYDKKRTVMNEADDDSHWIWGMVYYNKKDKHYMVESRLGTGTTINLGNKAGLITEIIAFGTLLLIPLMCVWMIMMEFTPLQVTVENDTIICKQLNVDYRLLLAEIDDYEVVTELPKNLIKVAGTGMDNLLSGTYEAYRQGTFELFLNPQNDLFIKITIDDEVYYIGGEDDEATQDVIDAIEAYVK